MLSIKQGQRRPDFSPVPRGKLNDSPMEFVNCLHYNILCSRQCETSVSRVHVCKLSGLFTCASCQSEHIMYEPGSSSLSLNIFKLLELLRCFCLQSTVCWALRLEPVWLVKSHTPEDPASPSLDPESPGPESHQRPSLQSMQQFVTLGEANWHTILQTSRSLQGAEVWLKLKALGRLVCMSVTSLVKPRRGCVPSKVTNLQVLPG